METQRCGATCRNGSPCSRNSKQRGMCTQHFKIYGGVPDPPIVREPKKKVLRKSPIQKRRNPFHSYNSSPPNNNSTNNTNTNNTNNNEPLKEWKEKVDDVDKCPICLDPVETKEEDVGFLCKHFCHTDCATGLRKLECPICKASINKSKLSKTQLGNIRKRHRDDINERKEESRRETQSLVARMNGEVLNNNNNNNNIMEMVRQMTNRVLQMQEMIEPAGNHQYENIPHENHEIEVNVPQPVRGTEEWDDLVAKAYEIITLSIGICNLQAEPHTIIRRAHEIMHNDANFQKNLKCCTVDSLLEEAYTMIMIE